MTPSSACRSATLSAGCRLASLLLLLALALCLVPSATAQFGCGGAGYDLTSIASSDLVYYGTGATTTTAYTLNPCRPISTGLCAGRNATFCYNTSATGVTMLSYYQPGVEVVAWSQLVGGVQSVTQNGALCYTGSTSTIIQSTVQYVCNSTVSAPFISSVVATSTCAYTAVVQTSLVCASPLAVTTPGLPYVSNVCGGGAYNLSTLDSTDFQFTVVGADAGTYWYRPCSNVSTSTCSGSTSPTSFCQYGQYSLGYGATPGATTYTVLSNGLLIQIQDGTVCNGYFPRASNTYLVCNASATTPYFQSFTETSAALGNGYSYCHYTTYIQTAAVCTLLPPSAVTAAPTPITLSFSAQTNTSVYPAVCTSGTIQCQTVPGSGNYTCSNVVSGTHTYYPSATAPSFSQALYTGPLPTVCQGYNASNTLPITAAGLNLQYGAGPTCINFYQSSATTGQIKLSPDAVTGNVVFLYGSASQVATCPAPIPPVATTTQAVGFVYTITSANLTVCGAGTLLCTGYGSNEFYCPTLQGGTQYNYAPLTGVVTSYPLSGEVECNSYGDGFLPLDYEGISFGGAFPRASTAKGSNCTSIYLQSVATGAVSISYNSVSSSNTTFTYSTQQLSYGAACARYIPAAINTTTTAPLPAGFGCGGAGYDLTSISGSDLQYTTSANVVVELNVCRPLATGACSGPNKNITFCYNGVAAAWSQPGVEVVAWSALAGGIQSTTQNGAACSVASGTTIITATVQYMCNATATTPYISNVVVGSCAYTAVVQTSLVCASPLAVTTPGLPYVSNVCGGGAYNLSTLDSTDFQFTVVGADAGTYWYRPCSNVSTSTCSGSTSPTSFCQYGQYSLGYGATPGATTYTVLSNGLLIQIQDGTVCNGYFPRASNTYLVCNASATTPYFQSFTETSAALGNGYSYCHYTTYIQTAAVCTLLPPSAVTAAPTPITLSFSAQTNTSVYPAVCTSGTIQCQTVPGSGNYTCSNVVSGTHTYYPSATAPLLLPGAVHRPAAHRVPGLQRQQHAAHHRRGAQPAVRRRADVHQLLPVLRYDRADQAVPRRRDGQRGVLVRLCVAGGHLSRSHPARGDDHTGCGLRLHDHQRQPHRVRRRHAAVHGLRLQRVLLPDTAGRHPVQLRASDRCGDELPAERRGGVQLVR